MTTWASRSGSTVSSRSASYRQSARVEPDVGPEVEVESDEFLLSGGIGSEKHFGPVLLGVSGTLNYTPGDFGDVSWVDLSVEVKLPLFGG